MSQRIKIQQFWVAFNLTWLRVSQILANKRCGSWGFLSLSILITLGCDLSDSSVPKKSIHDKFSDEKAPLVRHSDLNYDNSTNFNSSIYMNPFDAPPDAISKFGLEDFMAQSLQNKTDLSTDVVEDTSQIATSSESIFPQIEENNLTVEQKSCHLINHNQTRQADSLSSSQARITDNVIMHNEVILPNSESASNSLACQYARLNTLTFHPDRPWLNAIIWQNIAIIIQPSLVFEDLTDAREVVMDMLAYIESGDKKAKQFPLYLWIGTDFRPNANNTAVIKISSVQQRTITTPKLYYERIIMLDMVNEKPLQLHDVLLTKDAATQLLQLLQQTEKHQNGSTAKMKFDGPFYISKQWYLSGEGLHLVYQPGDIISGVVPLLDSYNSQVIDILVPYQMINEFLKPNYRFKPNLSNAAIPEYVIVTSIPIN